MVYRNYYARGWGNQSAWRRPGYAWNTRRQGYGYRPGYAWNAQRYGYAHRPGAYGWQAGQAGRLYGAWPAYRRAGAFAGRYWPQYLQYQRNWPWRYSYRSSPLAYGYPQQTYAPPPQVQVPAQDLGAPQPQALPPQWISWAQSCLSQAVGTWVPQNGVMGKSTRHAIRKFQKQQQLSATGMLDAATVNALQNVCGRAQAAAPPSAPPVPGPPAPAAPAGDDVAAASAAAASAGSPPDAPPPDAGAAPADGGAPPSDGAGAPDGSSGELYLRSSGRRRHTLHPRRRRLWGSGFNFAPAPPQPSDSDDGDDDDGELFRGEDRRFRGDMGHRPFESDRWSRRRW